MSDLLYCSFDDYSVVFNCSTGTFFVSTKEISHCASHVRVNKLFYKDMIIDPDSYTIQASESSPGRICITYARNDNIVPNYTIDFSINHEGVHIAFLAQPECRAEFSGFISWGKSPEQHTFPMSSIENSYHLRSAIGPAASYIDNMLFDRLTDSAISVTGGKRFRLHYDWNEKTYGFTLLTGIKPEERKFRVSVVRDIFANQYHFDYGPINKEGLYKKPPAGWMTWYSVGFDACEANVLENTEWQNTNLKPFGADTIWIDWEWHHADYSGFRDDGTDSLSPDPIKYPHGLGYLADKIKENGFVPALWIGYTNDPGENRFIRENPEIVLKKSTNWCGTYYYDMSHPKYLNEFLPKAIQQVRDWGYQAIKYDTLNDGLIAQEKFHMDSYDPSLTTKEMFRRMIQKTRECMGDDAYILSCCPTHQGIFWAGDSFDAARVGADTFAWDTFINEGILRVMQYYPIHNIVLYNDVDNLILSEQYNNYRQAASRSYFVGMLGLPMTFGDVLPELPVERVDLLKRCLPVMDIHPMDIKNHASDKRFLTINLNIEKPYESYNVVDVLNLQEESKEYELRLDGDLYLDEGEYHLYDFTNKQYLGYSDTKIALKLDSCESRVIAIRRKLDRPQLISTSRHITQGAAEITDMVWDDTELSLTLTSCLVADDEYTVTLYLPEGFSPSGNEQMKLISEVDGIYEYSLCPMESKKYTLKFEFEKRL